MKRIILTTTALVALLAASVAAAKITIYENEVNGEAAYKSIKLTGGKKKCKREWRKRKTLGFVVDRGRAACELRIPVEGDSKQPDHTIQAKAKLTNGTHKKAKESAFVGARVRASRKQGYELRIFPKPRRWSFLRNGKVIEEGRSREIDALGKKNLIRLASEDNTVVARVNNEVLTVLRDPNPGQVDGRKALLISGIADRTRKDAIGLFDDIKLIIPSP